ncbi:hypothetical protein ACFYOK_10870 [Microbispora bryophytorum]|uniref:hypothetical protein n=1 Tax=Microbispora bryophytorum TaxID=1460882 RepID=UPI003404745C
MSCPPWCRQPHARPDAPHLLDLGTVDTGRFILSVAILGDEQGGRVRLFAEDTTAQRERFHDLTPGAAGDLGHALTTLTLAAMRELGAMFATGADLLGEGQS